ncbi:MAG TPA: hypothetical protein VND19_10910 [Acetobacteraceae bacterium]|nr:hypothetical protein [Acetobacteraceae bacterium]
MREPIDSPDKPPEKNRAAAELGRRGGLKGGAMRAARMTPEKRAESARLAAQARWSRIRGAAEELEDTDQEYGPIVFTLLPDEAAYITQTTVAGRGGLQSFQRGLQRQLSEGNTVTLDDAGLGLLMKYISRYGGGGFQARLRHAFGRSLRELLGFDLD